MATSLAFGEMPRPWSIERIAGADGRVLERLRIGGKEIAVGDIESVTEERVAERDIQGLHLMGAIFLLAALLLLIAVADLGWRSRFLIGTVFLGALGVASFAEAWGVGTVAYRRLVITTRRGATLVFASADDREVDGLAAALGLGRQGLPAQR